MIKIKKKKILKTFFILIFILLTSFFIKIKSKNVKSFDDILFLKLFGNDIISQNLKSENKNQNKFEFDVKFKNTKLKNVDLLDTINQEKNVNEKIAPGTNGNFSIILKSNKNANYKIQFESYNQKPVNLRFKAFCDGEIISTEKNSLEELSENLDGNIKKNEIKIIIVNWFWDYENDGNKNADIQDTED